MAENVVGIDVVARLDQFRKELAAIPDIGGKEAKALTAQLSREIRAAEAAAKKANKGIADSYGDLADRGGKAAVKLRGALGAISPQAAALAGAVDDAADAFEGLGALGGPVLAGIAAVLATGFLAWKSYNEEGERASRIAAEVAEAHAAASGILDDTRLVMLDLGVATGDLTKLEAGLAKQSLATAAAIEQANAGTESRLKELRTQQQSWTTALADFVEVAEHAGGASWLVGKAFDGVLTSSSELQTEMDALTEAQRDNIATAKQNREAHEELTRTTSGNAAATKRATDLLKEWNEELAKSTTLAQGNATTYGDVLSALGALEDADRKAASTKAEAALLSHEAAQAELAALRDQGLAVASTTSARETIEQEYRNASLAENAAYYAEIKAMDAELTEARDKNAKEAAEAEARYRDAAKDAAAGIIGEFASVAQSASDIYANNAEELRAKLEDTESNLTSGQKAALEDRLKQQEDAAISAFHVGQVAAASEAAVNTFLGVSEALSAAPPPFNIALAGLALASGIAAEAQIASQSPPSFGDTPGVQKMGDEGLVRFAKDDYFAAAKDPRELQRQVGGGDPKVYVVSQVGHKQFDAQIARDMRGGGRLSKLAASGRAWRRSAR